MKVEEVPADTLVEMTPELYQEFCIGGCVPQCHHTQKWIRIGDKFKLSTVPIAFHPSGQTAGLYDLKTKEVMLSEPVLVEDFIKIQQQIVSNSHEDRRKRIASGHGGCFRINGKIVH